ncbi:MAG: PPC domain-containing protein, partial [Betaproteobacteria bacterium]
YYVGGSTAGSETLWVKAFDGIDWGAWQTFTMTTAAVVVPTNHPPVVSASNGSVQANQSVLMSSLFSASDADGNAITQYRFWDDTNGGGHFTVNGVAQPWSGSSITVNAANLPNAYYVGGSTAGSETLWVKAFDGQDWGAFTLFTMNTLTSPLTDGAGNSTAAAATVTVGATPTVVNDWVGATDTSDYYKLTLPSAGNLHLNLSGLTANADLGLLNSTGASIASSANAAAANETITRSVAAGTYYALVTPANGSNTGYALSMSLV